MVITPPPARNPGMNSYKYVALTVTGKKGLIEHRFTLPSNWKPKSSAEVDRFIHDYNAAFKDKGNKMSMGSVIGKDIVNKGNIQYHDCGSIAGFAGFSGISAKAHSELREMKKRFIDIFGVKQV